MNIWLKIIVYSFLSLFLFIGIAIGVDIWQFRSGSAVSTADIISIREEYSSGEDSDGYSEIDVSYYPTVRFVDQNGIEYLTEADEPVLDRIPEIGDQIDIRYFIENPGWVRPDYGFWRDWFVAGGIISIGLFLLTVTHLALRRKVPEI